MDYKLSKDEWERILELSETMLREAYLSELSATMMSNRAKQEINQIEVEDGNKLLEGKKEGVQDMQGAKG